MTLETTTTTTTTMTVKNTHQTQSILSDKVSRALQVRTDTPAMKAALQALSSLEQQQQQQQQQQQSQWSSSSTSASATEKSKSTPTSSYQTASASAAASAAVSVIIVDSRTVRVAIEQDALQQAISLQTELRGLVESIQSLRQGVAETAAAAHRVKQAIHTPVVTEETPISMLAPESGTGSNNNKKAAAAAVSDTTTTTKATTTTTTSSSSSSSSLQQEQDLASQLADAFWKRNLASKRLQAVQAFLEKFDLSHSDSRLLDHYNFEDMSAEYNNNNNEQSSSTAAATTAMDTTTTNVTESSGTTTTSPNGMAFLQALERVGKIRQALIETFGEADLMMSDATRDDDDDSDHHALLLSSSEQYQQQQQQYPHRAGLGASSALRMMEGLAQKQERAYERLYHWLQKYLHLFTTNPGIVMAGGGGTAGSSSSGNASLSSSSDYDHLDEALQHPFVKRSLYTLKHVPAFYSHTLELVASSRRTEETRRFLLALTSGYGGFPPIEMKSHDPVAYLGDMLAFSFKAFSMEADVAKGLLLYKPEDEDDDEGNNKEQDTKLDGSEQKERKSEDKNEDDYLSAEEQPMSASDMLSISMSGLSRPLKSRILQVISTLSRRPDDDDVDSDEGINDDMEEEGAVVRHRLAQLYEICGLLLFYVAAMEKGVRKLEREDVVVVVANKDETEPLPQEKNPLIAALLECLVEATNAYEATIRVYAAMMDQLSAMTGDSEATLAHSMLVLVADVRISSPGFSSDVECPSECKGSLSIEWVTETLVEAALASCKTLDDAVVLKQSIAASKKAGMSVLTAEKLDEAIDDKESSLIEELVQAESSKVLDLCGLGSLSNASRRWLEVQAADDGVLMASYPGLSQEEVEGGMKEFYASLFSPPLPSLETTIKDPVLRKMARSKIASSVCDTYSELYAGITSSEKGGYDDISFLSHDPNQVKTLFSA